MIVKSFKVKLSIVLVMLLLMSSIAAAQDSTSTETQDWQFHSIVDVDFVQAHRSVPMPEDVMLIDARPYKPKFVNGYIPGAVSIPDSQFDKMVDLLPKNKDTLLIYYCEGLQCKLSHKSAKKAEALGYTNVKVFAKGYPEWIKTTGEYAAVSVEYVAEAIDSNEALIVDARPQKPKFNKGHIPSAINIPFTDFEKLSGKLPRDLNTPVIFYCGGLECRLSHKSAKAALALGYTNVKVFEKGYPEWKSVYGAAGQEIAVKAGDVEGSMDIDTFVAIEKNNPDSIMIIDTRDKDEFAKGSFNTAVNIPVEDLEDKVKELPEDKPIVFVCSTGARSGESFYMVQELRPTLKKVYYLEAAITFKEKGVYEIKKNES